ncbi:hypothetical protein F4X86_00950 [Candidatus Saccharibacteria bacterium]|nr:hypothetical protein [Candidatus Saccharibacteria bacterium]
MSPEKSVQQIKIYERSCLPALLITATFYVLSIWLILITMQRLGMIGSGATAMLVVLAVALIVAWMWRKFSYSISIHNMLKERRYQAIYTLGPDRSKIIKSTIRDELESPFSDSFELVRLETRQISKNFHLDKHNFWYLYDVVSNIYRKNGDMPLYKSRQAFYTVFEAKLQRTVPHLVFDSKAAKGKQFGHIYLQAQRLSLDGNFDDYFDAYSPQGYEIDTLSFITPEVIVAMLEMHDCDIEFVEDGLMCYAPLLDKKSLADFKEKCLNLYASVNDNLNTYRDNRLSENRRAHDVSIMAKRLIRDPMRHAPMTIFSGVATASLIIIIGSGLGSEALAGLFYVLIPTGGAFLYHLLMMVDTFRSNRLLMNNTNLMHE